ncbi:MAG: hypothetical protein Tsb0016_13490 [Sphingomonadales bacterium]
MAGKTQARTQSVDVLDWVAKRWRAASDAARANPLSNPILETALALNDACDAKTVSIDDLEQAAARLGAGALIRRAGNARDYIGDLSAKVLERRLDAMADALIGDNGKPRPFKAFSSLLESEALGLVITAHPTFSMTEPVTDMLVDMIGAGPAKRAKQSATLAEMDLRPNLTITLDDERRMAGRALANAQEALSTIYEGLLSRAEAVYGDRVWRLRPRLASIASWVGYDLDGRSDISWATSLGFRYLSAAEQTARYGQEWRALAKDWAVAKAAAVQQSLDELAALYQELADMVPSRPNDIAQARALALASVKHNNRRKALIAALDADLAALQRPAQRDGRATQLARFTSRLKHNGFGISHIHFRLNAAQLHNAVRPAVAMDTSPDAASNRRRYLGALSELLGGVKPVRINYGSLMRESTTARRLFMVIAQILKFVDDTAPIRLLIAESDTPFTVLTALYYAKLFGIDDKVEICPLFETDAGLERGAKVIEELLGDPHYRAYVKAQGRLCVQTGYSDAGRYLGQLAAGLAIERFRIKLGQLWASHDLGDVQLVIFDTHGESVGRGAHPEGMAARLEYVHSARARAVFAANKVRYKQEISLQGGDGYVWLWTPKLARATVSQMLARAIIGPQTDNKPDPFYVDTDYSLDFFLTLKEFQARTVHDPDYLPMLTGFGVNMLYPSGSRMTLRQSESGKVTRASHVEQIRAIPHNAILQQMGYLANTLGGAGTAVAKDTDSYLSLRDRSHRLQRLRAMLRHAARFSDLRVFEGYLSLFDPEYWLHYAAHEEAPKRRERMQRLSGQLARMSVDVDHGRVIRAFWRDRNDLTGALEGNVPRMTEGDGEELVLIHILRLALIQQLFLLTARIPRFSSRPDLTIEDVIEQLLRLDVARALTTLREIFPIEPETTVNGDFGEPATFQGDASRGYAYENRVLFDAIERIHDLIRRLGIAVIHHIGAYG